MFSRAASEHASLRRASSFYPHLSAAPERPFTISTQSPDDGMLQLRDVLIPHGAGGGRYTPKRFWCCEYIPHSAPSNVPRRQPIREARALIRLGFVRRNLQVLSQSVLLVLACPFKRNSKKIKTLQAEPCAIRHRGASGVMQPGTVFAAGNLVR